MKGSGWRTVGRLTVAGLGLATLVLAVSVLAVSVPASATVHIGQLEDALVRLVAPAPGRPVTGTVELRATPEHAPDGAGVRYLVDDVVVGVSFTAPYPVPWDSTAVPDGRAMLAAELVDAGGVPLGARATRRITVANQRGPAAAEPAVVTLGFDDGTADQYQVGPLLESLGMRAVFYVNSGRLSTTAKYMTTAQAVDLAARGHEIGGHTVFHLHLDQLDGAEQARQICTDRDQLLALGLKVSDLAYPFGGFAAATQQTARACGYSTGRTSEGISCSRDCAPTESIPPANPYQMHALSGLGRDTTVDFLETAATRAVQAGGWLQYVFHHVCTAAPCESTAIPIDRLTAFLHWLADQQHARRLVVRTARQVVPARDVGPVPAPPPTATRVAVANGSLEAAGPDPAVPRCFQYGTSGGDNTVTWSRVPDPHTGSWAVRAEVTSVGAGVSLLTIQDLGSCAPPIVAGHRYSIGVWYKSTAPVKLVAYSRMALGGYQSFGGSKMFPAGAGWQHASWTTRPAPATGAYALGMGLALRSVGSYVIDDLTVADAGLPVPKAHHVRAPHRTARTVRLVAHLRPPASTRAMDMPVPFLPPMPPLILVAPAPVPIAMEVRRGWTFSGEAILALSLVFALVLALDRRFRHVQRATRLPARHGRRPRLPRR